ncbi:nucleotidyltransferase domain-containing protein [Acinetobacter sp. C26M]|uniref:nucleotidyltransferase domain-containing protein n=1 Tax=unclassified Acinetobacter TaxID=196816 RepID=UPI002036D8B1|nr:MULTISPECIES: nucleotidyltransferase domain-containing protein [unclassified Acinetobacter]USA46876.1 nucleotidyltransferase domain-containing protein [Acinetobacter sp. C26M]USA50358.1 nucleotidyltransferase domain-containing protein [Acinetobacter sp. C26G]
MNIHHEIEKLFQQRQDIPLFYIESGSRLWGMASPDSDYDVRGFHLPSKDQYYDYKKHRDLIEIMDGDFDFVSYDLNKMFGLLAKSNPTVLEWVRAHIVYFNAFPEWQIFRDGLLERIDYSALYHHYLSLAKGGMKVMQTADNFTYKKVFYSIRGLMSAELATREQMPELLITDLFAQVDANDPLRHWAEDYLEIKKQQQEKAQLPQAEQAAILQLLQSKIEQLAAKSMPKADRRASLEAYLTDYSRHLKQHYYQ